MTGYGPQETWEEEEKLPFFVALDQEIIKAKTNGKSVFLAFDANSKMGPDYIPKDPHKCSPNGDIMSEIIEKNALIVVNGLEQKSVGVITRERCTEDGNIERSAIDLVIVSEDLEEHVLSLNIEEERKNVLPKITINRQGVVKVQ